MIKKILGLIVFISALPVVAYTPSFESLFRRGKNPDLTSNAVRIKAQIQPYYYDQSTLEQSSPSSSVAPTTPPSAASSYSLNADKSDGQKVWIEWIFYSPTPDSLKLVQVIHHDARMDSQSVSEKRFFSSWSAAQTYDKNAALEKALFYGLMSSLAISDGSFLTQALRHFGVSVPLNDDSFDREKLNLIQEQKAWLAQTKGGKDNPDQKPAPLSPQGYEARKEVSKILQRPLVSGDEEKIKLTRFEGKNVWSTNYDPFFAYVTDQDREPLLLQWKKEDEDIMIRTQDWRKYADLVELPQTILFKTIKQQFYQIQILSFQPFNENADGMTQKLKKWDEALKQKKEIAFKPSFIL
jgi:hypothetical protein